MRGIQILQRGYVPTVETAEPLRRRCCGYALLPYSTRQPQKQIGYPRIPRAEERSSSTADGNSQRVRQKANRLPSKPELTPNAPSGLIPCGCKEVCPSPYCHLRLARLRASFRCSWRSPRVVDWAAILRDLRSFSLSQHIHHESRCSTRFPERNRDPAGRQRSCWAVACGTR